MVWNRRRFLKWAVVGSASAVVLPKAMKTFGWSSAFLLRGDSLFSDVEIDAASDAFSPFERVSSPATPDDFLGDTFRRPHRALWNKAEYLAERGGIPKPTEKVKVVVVGGGLSGLFTAYKLRDLKPLLLEQSPRIGGNAKGERWRDLTYATGSAFVTNPEEGSDIHTLLTELDLLKELKIQPEGQDPVLMGSSKHMNFWEGQTDPSQVAAFQAFSEKIKTWRTTLYPEIPFKPDPDSDSEMTEEKLFALDRKTFAQWLEEEMGPLHPHMVEMIELYCWDSFGATPRELSAAQGLNFFLADNRGLAALAGGNARISEKLMHAVLKDRSDRPIRTDALVVDVSVQPAIEGKAPLVWVCYEDREGKLRTVEAEACVIASPKFVAKRVVTGLPAEQEAAISKLRYRAYLVTNVLIDRPVPAECFGYMVLKGSAPDPEDENESRPFSSAVFGHWASLPGNPVTAQPGRSVITLYRAHPSDFARGDLMSKASYVRAKKAIEDSLPDLFKMLGIATSEIKAIRITRHGHALPLAAPNLIADQTLVTASKPIGDRIFFANQDNWANPCVESALSAAIDATSRTRVLFSVV